MIYIFKMILFFCDSYIYFNTCGKDRTYFWSDFTVIWKHIVILHMHLKKQVKNLKAS